MKILLTGANGFVGARIKAALPVTEAPSLRQASLDDIKRTVDAVAPDVIIHTAAISDISACERDPEASHYANVLIPEYLARAANGVKVVMFSTDQVYSGCPGPGPYTEQDAQPANRYARHKLEMERRVLDIRPDAVMLRATWMCDMPLYGTANRGNFLVNMLRAAMAHTPVAFSKEQYRGITYVREAAALMHQAILLPGGVYNFGSENTLSMYKTAQFLKKELGLDVEISAAGTGHNLWMDCGKLEAQGWGFGTTADGLRACIADYNLTKMTGGN